MRVLSDSLVNGLNRLPQRLVLVLDDYQAISESTIDELLPEMADRKQKPDILSEILGGEACVPERVTPPKPKPALRAGHPQAKRAADPSPSRPMGIYGDDRSRLLDAEDKVV